MSHYNKLPFGIISFNRFLNTGTTNIVSSYDKNELVLFEMVCEE